MSYWTALVFLAWIASLFFVAAISLERSEYLSKDVWTRSQHGPIPGIINRTEYGVGRLSVDNSEWVVALDSGEILVYTFDDKTWRRLK